MTLLLRYMRVSNRSPSLFSMVKTDASGDEKLAFKFAWPYMLFYESMHIICIMQNYYMQKICLAIYKTLVASC